MTAIERSRLAELHPVMRAPVQEVLAVVGAAIRPDGLEVYLAETGRSDAEAAANWAKGRQALPDGSWEIVDEGAIVTRTQHSKHQRRPPDRPWPEAADIWVRRVSDHKPLWHSRDPKKPMPPAVAAAYDLLRAVCESQGLLIPLNWDRYHVQMGRQLEARARSSDREARRLVGGAPSR